MATFVLVLHPFNPDGTVSKEELRFEAYDNRHEAQAALTAAIATGRFASGKIEASL